MTMFARQQAAQIALPPRVGHHRREGIGRRRVLPSALVVAEEEQLVLEDRPADRAAERIAREVGLRAARPVRGPRRRRQLVVTQIVEAVAAELIGPRLDDHVDDGAGHVAELRRVVVRLDADLLHRIRARLVEDAVVDALVRVDAVDREVVALDALAVDRRPAAAAHGVELVGIRGGHPGHVQRRRRQVAPLRRQALDLLPFHDLADDRVLGLQHRAHRHDVDPFLDAADLHLEVDARRLRRGQRHLRLRAFESRQIHGHHVLSDRDARDDVVAGIVGDAGVGDVRRLVGGGDGHAGHRATGRVRDKSGHGGQAGLRRGRQGHHEPDQRDKAQAQEGGDKATHSKLPFLESAIRGDQ